MGRVYIGVSQPILHDGDIISRLEQVHGCCVPPRMRSDFLGLQGRTPLFCFSCVLGHEVANPEACDGLAPGIDEHRGHRSGLGIAMVQVGFER